MMKTVIDRVESSIIYHLLVLQRYHRGKVPLNLQISYLTTRASGAIDTADLWPGLVGILWSIIWSRNTSLSILSQQGLEGKGSVIS